MPASLEITGPLRAQALTSIQRYAEENFGEPLGDLAAGNLLDFFLAEVAPLVYNQAVTDVQERLQHRIGELHGEIYADTFQYWSRLDKRRRSRG